MHSCGELAHGSCITQDSPYIVVAWQPLDRHGQPLDTSGEVKAKLVSDSFNVLIYSIHLIYIAYIEYIDYLLNTLNIC